MSTVPTEPAKEAKKPKLSRSSSIEKFNALVCSKSYYYLINALLFWLKTSQTLIQRSIEATISQAKRICNVNFIRQMSLMFLLNLTKYEQYTKNSVKSLVSKTCNLLSDEFKAQLERIVIYSAVFAIMGQFLVLLYLTTNICPPIGMVFLITCTYMIGISQFQILYFDWYKQPKIEAAKRQSRDRTKRSEQTKEKKILGNRTISKLQFF